MSKDTIHLKIPRKADYISLVRLTSSSIAYNLNMNIDEIEDIKVCIGEACNNSLSLSDKKEISIIFEVDSEKITIEVDGVIENIPEELDENNERELGLLIIRTLMDSVEYNDIGIRMTKYIE